MGKTFSDIYLTNVFSGQSSKATEIKASIHQWDLIKLTSFCTGKETKKKTKRQFTEWGKIVSNDVTDKGLISKIYKQCIQLNNTSTVKKKNKNKNKQTKKTTTQLKDGQKI